MSSLLEVMDAFSPCERKKLLTFYINNRPLGKLPPLEKAYFQVLYDLLFMSTLENENNYSEFKMTNIIDVVIEYDAERFQRYFMIYYVNNGSLRFKPEAFDHEKHKPAIMCKETNLF